MAGLFRDTALDTMATPEQLDKQVKIMGPSVWVVFTAMIAALITFIIWSFTYKISDGINMTGVVYSNTNIVNNTADRDCVVKDILVEEGDYVNIGSIIGVVTNDGELEKIENLRDELKSLEEGSEEYTALQEKLDNLVDQYVSTTIIKSNTSGYVQSVSSVGEALSAGDSIVMIMTDAGYQEVIAYVPLQTAKSLSLGMTAQISPSYAPREEYGYMTGVITAISDTPATEKSIINRMGTMSYVENILPDGSFVEVRIRLDLDEGSSNSYKWSNQKGENLTVELGTQCSVFAVTREYLPIQMLLE